MKLTLHIGMGKTGTTALQTFLSDPGGLPEDIGLLHPGVCLRKLQSDFVLASQGEVAQTQKLRAALQALEAAALARPGTKTVFWFNESLSSVRPRERMVAEIGAFFAQSKVFDELEIIVVLRRQDEWIESAYRQWGLRHKQHHRREIITSSEFLERSEGSLDYLALYRAWAELGPDVVRVISYDDLREAGGIVRYFARDLGIEWRDDFARFDEIHESLGPSLCYFNAVLNRGFVGPALPRPFKRLLKRYDLPELSAADVGFFPTEEREEILARYVDDNRKLARLALGREALFADRPVKQVKRYATGMEDVLTYLSLIAWQEAERRPLPPVRPAKN